MSTSRLAGAIAGSLVAGLGLTALLLAGERKSGKPSEIVDLERASAAKLGLAVPRRNALPDAREQAIAQGGHLLLSAAAGAVYAAATDEDAPIVSSGVAFGLVFYAAMHWLLGPLLGVKPPEWRSGGGTIGMHALNHVLFGVITAAFAGAASRRRQRGQ